MMLGIQADDLTGACDTGAPFAARGLETLVIVSDGDGPPALPRETPAVLVLDTESRTATGEEARARARAVGSALKAGPPRILYKKVDSTLRGHVAAELDGMLDGSGLAVALLAPAFPAQRRTVADGCLRVDGRPAGETAVARDPAFPRTGASVLGLLAAGGVAPVTAVPLATVRCGQDEVGRRLHRFAGTGGACWPPMPRRTPISRSSRAPGLEGPVLLAGSAGLAVALAARLSVAEPTEREAPPIRLRRPVLVVAGSAHPATREQIGRLGRREDLDVLAPPASDGADDPARRRATAARLAAAARARIERWRPGTLLLTGGETAIAVLKALGAGGLRLAGEIEPGVALGALVGGPFDGLVLVTKAGGFGDAETLVRVWEAAR